MGALQIDTIHVVARSPYLVLFSRLGDYEPAWLDELLAEGRLFEYWSHAACFLPIEDYPLYVSRMQKLTGTITPPNGSNTHQPDHSTWCCSAFATNGEVRSADFERTDGKKGTWWDWKVEKRSSRIPAYQRSADDRPPREVPARLRPARAHPARLGGCASTLTLEEAQDELTLRAVRALGAAPARWVPDYYRLPKPGMPARLERLAENGTAHCASLSRPRRSPGTCTRRTSPCSNTSCRASRAPRIPPCSRPSIPLTWDRERARVLFDFDFTLECYVPQAKRRYGYFLLPILHEGNLVGRLDAKAHRKEFIFEVRALYLEPSAKVDEDTARAIAGAIWRCAEWHGAAHVAIRKTEPEMFGAMLTQALGSQVIVSPPGQEFAEEEVQKDVQELL